MKEKLLRLRALADRQAMKVATVAGLGLAGASAFADTTVFDPTSYVTAIGGTVAGILAIGGAVFGVYVAIKSTKWATRSL